MTTKITESAIEDFSLTLLEQIGYSYITADVWDVERLNNENVLLYGRIAKAAARINPTLAYECVDDAIKQIQRLNSSDLINNNKAFHRMLTEGVTVT